MASPREEPSLAGSGSGEVNVEVHPGASRPNTEIPVGLDEVTRVKGSDSFRCDCGSS